MKLFRVLAAIVLIVSVAAPPVALAASSKAKHRTKIIVRKKLWHGYGFLPGYHPSLAEINGVPVLGPDPRPKREARYFDYYGNVHYGWGGPGFYRGRYNGGSFGPCYQYTPIGMMPTC